MESFNIGNTAECNNTHHAAELLQFCSYICFTAKTKTIETVRVKA